MDMFLEYTTLVDIEPLFTQIVLSDTHSDAFCFLREGKQTDRGRSLSGSADSTTQFLQTDISSGGRRNILISHHRSLLMLEYAT
jgi:hypothetical protein